MRTIGQSSKNSQIETGWLKRALVKAYEKEEAMSKQREKDRLVTKCFAREESLQTLPHYEPPVQHSSFDPQELSTT